MIDVFCSLFAQDCVVAGKKSKGLLSHLGCHLYRPFLLPDEYISVNQKVYYVALRVEIQAIWFLGEVESDELIQAYPKEARTARCLSE